jgi:hypothetical protein
VDVTNDGTVHGKLGGRFQCHYNELLAHMDGQDDELDDV